MMEWLLDYLAALIIAAVVGLWALIGVLCRISWQASKLHSAVETTGRQMSQNAKSVGRSFRAVFRLLREHDKTLEEHGRLLDEHGKLLQPHKEA